jgi:hypothetical protein
MAFRNNSGRWPLDARLRNATVRFIEESFFRNTTRFLLFDRSNGSILFKLMLFCVEFSREN